MKAFLSLRWSKLVQFAGARPLLVILLADGTPVKALRRAWFAVNDEETIQRTGKRSSEFWVLRAFGYCMDAMGVPYAVTMNRDPVSAHKKDAWTIYSIIDAFLPFSRQLGAAGLLTTVYVMDGGLFDSQRRKLRQRHAQWYATHGAQFDTVSLELMDFTLAI